MKQEVYHMKFGCCVDIRNTALVLACKDAGVDHIETSLSGLYTIPQREVNEIAKMLRENDLQLAGFNGMYPWKFRLTGEWVDEQKINSYLFEVLEKASVFCPEYIVFGSGGPRRVPDGFSKEVAFAQLANTLKEQVSPIFAQYGVKCAIEPLNYSECNIINTVLEGEAVADVSRNAHIFEKFCHILEDAVNAVSGAVEFAVGLQNSADFRQSTMEVRDMVEHHVGDDHVKRIVGIGNILDIHNLKIHVFGGNISFCGGQHSF